MDTQEVNRAVRLREAEQISGYKRQQIAELVKQGKFPKPFSLSVRTDGRAGLIAWRLHDLLRWLDAREAESRDKQAA